MWVILNEKNELKNAIKSISSRLFSDDKDSRYNRRNNDISRQKKKKKRTPRP